MSKKRHWIELDVHSHGRHGPGPLGDRRRRRRRPRYPRSRGRRPHPRHPGRSQPSSYRPRPSRLHGRRARARPVDRPHPDRRRNRGPPSVHGSPSPTRRGQRHDRVQRHQREGGQGLRGDRREGAGRRLKYAVTFFLFILHLVS